MKSEINISIFPQHVRIHKSLVLKVIASTPWSYDKIP